MKSLSAHTVPELKAELIQRNVVLTGKEKKADLIDQLKAILASETGSAGHDSKDEAAGTHADAVVAATQGGSEVADAAPDAEDAAPQVTSGQGHKEGQSDADVAMGDAAAAAGNADDGVSTVGVDQEMAEAAAVAQPQQDETAAAGAAVTTPAAKPVEQDYGPEEWILMPDIPVSWRPLPVLRVKGLAEGTTPEQVQEAFDQIGVPVFSVAIEEVGVQASKSGQPNNVSALVRLPAPELPWKLSEDDLRLHPLDLSLPATSVKGADPSAPDAAAEVGTSNGAVPASEATVVGGADVGDKEAAVGDAPVSVGAAVEGGAGEVGEAAAVPATTAADSEATAAVVEAAATAATPVASAAAPAKAPAAAVPLATVPHDDGRRDGDVAKVARYYAARISNTSLVVSGDKVSVEAANVTATLFLGNLPDGENEAKLQSEMEEYGPVQRCFIMRNAAGESKFYGFVEFTQPVHASKAHSDLDAAFNKAHRDAQQQRFDRRKAAAAAARLAAQPVAAPAAATAKDSVASAEGAPSGAAGGEAAADVAVGDEKHDDVDWVKVEAADVVGAPPAQEELIAATKAESTEDTAMAAADQVKPELGADAAVDVKAEVKLEGGEANAGAAVDDAAGTAAAAADGGDDASGSEKQQPRILRAEFSNARTVPSLFSRNLYVANVAEGLKDETGFRAAFAAFGPLTTCQVAKGPMGYSRGFAFVEFRRSDHAEAAFKALNDVDSGAIGHLLLSFVNPAKERRSTYVGGAQQQQQRAYTPYGRGSAYQSAPAVAARVYGFGYKGGRTAPAAPGGYGGSAAYGGGGYGYGQPAAVRGHGGSGGGYGPGRGAYGGQPVAAVVRGYGGRDGGGAGYAYGGDSAGRGRGSYASPGRSAGRGYAPAAAAAYPQQQQSYGYQAGGAGSYAAGGAQRALAAAVPRAVATAYPTAYRQQASGSAAYSSAYGGGQQAYQQPAASYSARMQAPAAATAGYDAGYGHQAASSYGQQAAGGYGQQYAAADTSGGYGQQYSSAYGQQAYASPAAASAYSAAAGGYGAAAATPAGAYGAAAAGYGATAYGYGEQSGYGEEPSYKRPRQNY